MHSRKLSLAFLAATVLLGMILSFRLMRPVNPNISEGQQNTSSQFSNSLMTDDINVIKATVIYGSPYDDIYEKIKNAEATEEPVEANLPYFTPIGFSENEQYTYDEFVKGVKAGKESVWVPIRVDTERITPIAETMYMAPDIIGLDREVGFDVKSDGSSYVIFPPYCVGTPDELKEMEREMAEVAEEVYRIADSLHMTETIRDYSDFVCLWLAANCQYSPREEYSANDRTAYGALIQHEAVCVGYVNAYQYLMGYAGYETALVRGMYQGEGEDDVGNHAWAAYHDGDTLVYCDPTYVASRKQNEVAKWDKLMYFTDLSDTPYTETAQLWFKPVGIIH